MGHGLIKDIKGDHIHLWSSSKSFIDKSYDGYTVSPVIAADRLPNLAILSCTYCSFFQGKFS
jgi:hypothetical protein